MALLLLLLAPAVRCTSSPKRGLVYVPSTKHPADDKIWLTPPSDLTWYYNYQSTPSPVFVDTQLQFVPQLWGVPSGISDTFFLDSVKSQINAGANITYVLGFNEPDASTGGGSGISTDLAAQTWNREIAPLRGLGVKLGAPAVTGAPSGLTWLRDFFTACNCTADFIPVHWYGNFEGLASHIGEVRAAYPNQTIWVTEYALAHENLQDTQKFYNQSSEYFDRIDYITHYSYFGSFRSDVSNVGGNAAMLTQDGKLTDIGSWYLGRDATGNVPKGGAGKKDGFGGWGAVVVAVVAGIGALGMV
ncbi:hypothetical protein GP486_003170 [Trichoglossum hirsutum]|uniref:Asl1-like glycosyl hydrolase catalytic domain-containing protein n=1 Tax=Trichoglossum hirsutum TaxID=265104 RepID=A0A9P8LDS9_9PEZI|nr:hypothetical protein GP486_003170 [Trichoglossum hirsutum]